MKKRFNVKKKALLIFALIAILFVLHGIMTSSPAMAEHVFSASQDVNTELVASPQIDEAESTSHIGAGLYSFWQFTGFRNCTSLSVWVS